MVEFIDQASEKYDMIIFDTPPVLHHNATLALGSKVDKVLFIISANQGSRKIIGKALEMLKAAKVTLLGTVLNRIRAGEGYYYYYYYYYGDDHTEKRNLWRRIRRIFKKSKHRRHKPEH
jgi:Mrp family chromosome partitioning ATPase